MDKIMWMVQVYDEDFDKWNTVPLGMCNSERNCGCLKRNEMDVCDNFFHDTPYYNIAKTQADYHKKQGDKVRILIREVNIL